MIILKDIYYLHRHDHNEIKTLNLFLCNTVPLSWYLPLAAVNMKFVENLYYYQIEKKKKSE